jgi:DNA-binding NtrC family response regulator
MKRILVIDDNDDVREELSDLFSDVGFGVSTARDGRDGLKQMAASHFDLVITDILMPDMEGLEFILAIKKAHPAIKIIAISGGGRYRNMSFLEMAKKFGADRAFEKPLPIKALLKDVVGLVNSPRAA